eukprot:1391241-Amorphochlora_amoeboformis.AAC.1
MILTQNLALTQAIRRTPKQCLANSKSFAGALEVVLEVRKWLEWRQVEAVKPESSRIENISL